MTGTRLKKFWFDVCEQPQDWLRMRREKGSLTRGVGCFRIYHMDQD